MLGSSYRPPLNPLRGVGKMAGIRIESVDDSGSLFDFAPAGHIGGRQASKRQAQLFGQDAAQRIFKEIVAEMAYVPDFNGHASSPADGFYIGPRAYPLRVPAQAAELIRGLHPQIKRKLRAALADMMVNPHAGKALKDELAGLWSFRVGKLRIVYRISDRVARKRCVELVACGPRERIYEETYRLLARGH